MAVFAEGDAAEEAREAGATQVGGLEFIEEIKKGEMLISLKLQRNKNDLLVMCCLRGALSSK